MTHKETVKSVKQYFDIRELVSERVHKVLGEAAWRLFDPRLLETLLVLRRDILKVPLVCNNWKNGGYLSNRGFRDNLSSIVTAKTAAHTLYMSAHMMGMALDLSSGKLSADQMRRLILDNQHLLPYQIRMESGKSAPTWLHIDVSVPPGQEEKVYVFD